MTIGWFCHFLIWFSFSCSLILWYLVSHLKCNPFLLMWLRARPTMWNPAGLKKPLDLSSHQRLVQKWRNLLSYSCWIFHYELPCVKDVFGANTQVIITNCRSLRGSITRDKKITDKTFYWRKFIFKIHKVLEGSRFGQTNDLG